MSDATTTVIVAVLTSSSIAAIFAALINGAFTKRKLSAESTELIQRAASGVVQDMREQLDAAKREMTDLRIEQRAEIARMRDEHRAQVTGMIEEHLKELQKRDRDAVEERERWRHLLQLHVAWDWIAIETLAALNIDLPDPPPILPKEPPPGIREMPSVQRMIDGDE